MTFVAWETRDITEMLVHRCEVFDKTFVGKSPDGQKVYDYVLRSGEGARPCRLEQLGVSDRVEDLGKLSIKLIAAEFRLYVGGDLVIIEGDTQIRDIKLDPADADGDGKTYEILPVQDFPNTNTVDLKIPGDGDGRVKEIFLKRVRPGG